MNNMNIKENKRVIRSVNNPDLTMSHRKLITQPRIEFLFKGVVV